MFKKSIWHLLLFLHDKIQKPVFVQSLFLVHLFFTFFCSFVILWHFSFFTLLDHIIHSRVFHLVLWSVPSYLIPSPPRDGMLAEEKGSHSSFGMQTHPAFGAIGLLAIFFLKLSKVYLKIRVVVVYWLNCVCVRVCACVRHSFCISTDLKGARPSRLDGDGVRETWRKRNYLLCVGTTQVIMNE